MKLTDFLTDVGKPISYYPELKKITGSVTATILLCQFIYWRGKQADKDGWLYKTSDEIEEETGLSYNEQKTARAKLVEAGLIEEHYARLDHQLRFLVNLDAINEKWGKPQNDVPESDNVTLGNDTFPYSLNESEITTEKTTNTDELSKNLPIDWKVAAGIEITDDDLEKEQRPRAALNEFERVFGFGTLPWNSNTVWDKFAKFIVKTFADDPGWMRDYVDWREDKGKYKAFSNRKIRENPQAFIDTGYPEYDASKMYRQESYGHAL